MAWLRLGGLLLALAGPLAAQPSLRREEWQLEWGEEFNQRGDSSALMNHWRFDYPWGRSLPNNPECEYYTGASLYLDGQHLNLVAARRTEPLRYRNRDLLYNSGMVFSRHPGPDSLRPATCPGGDGFSYGLFEIRCRQPRDHNAFPAFWLFGHPDEVDIFEGDFSAFGSTIHVYPNPYWRPEMDKPTECSCGFYNTDKQHNLHQAYHTYSLAWRPNELVFYFDGYPIRRETRYAPLGCPMTVIANLAMLNWATPTTDTLAIDYIRVYRPRHPYRDAGLLRPGGAGPHPSSAWLPATTNPALPDPTPRQEWDVRTDATGPLRLHLAQNHNPACGMWLALPNAQAAAWSPPLTLEAGLPALCLRFIDPAPAAWALLDPLGQPVLAGTVPAGTEWRPQWAALPPGFYRLRLRQGVHEVVHPMVVLGRPAASAPDAAWRRPSVAEVPKE